MAAGGNDVEIKVGSQDNTAADFDALKAKIDDLKRARADITIDANDKDATLALARIDATIARLNDKAAKPSITVSGAARAEADIAGVDLAMDKLSKSGDGAASSAAGLGESLGALGSPMAGLIAGVVALAPVLVTVGIGTAGFGAAAYGAIAPIEKAAQATGGLQANMHTLNPEQQGLAKSILALGGQYSAFQKDLQPEVVSAFGSALKLAANLMTDVEPVARATGQAIDTLLQGVDREFQSGTWKNFFSWMAATAGPDIKLLGGSFINLMNTLPPLLEELQPVATDLLAIVDASTKIIDVGTHVTGVITGTSKATNIWEGELHGLGTALAVQFFPSLVIAQKAVDKFTGSTDTAVHSVNTFAGVGSLVKHALDPIALSAQAAATQIKFLNADWNTLVGNFATKEVTLQQTTGAFDTLRKSIDKTGASSSVSKGLFEVYIQQIGTGITALQNSGQSIKTQNGYLQTQIDRLESLGKLNPEEQKQLQGLKLYQDQLANSTAGWNTKMLTAAKTMENSLIPDLVKLHADTPKVKTDIDNLTTAIFNTGTKSAASHHDRAQLIADLEASGVKASTAKGLVDGYIKSLGRIPGHENTNIGVSAKGQWTISELSPGGPGGDPRPLGTATGRLVTGGTPGRDSVLLNAMPGEVVVPTSMVNAGAVDHLRGKIPGFGGGGVVGSYAGSAPGAGRWTNKEFDDTNSAVVRETENAMLAGIKAAIAGAQSTGGGHPGPGGGAPSANAALARKLVPKWGSGAEWAAWNNVAMRESGWSNTIMNPASQAYGIAQALPYTKYPKAGWPPSAGGSANPTAQITWMASYMGGRYGDPLGAWAHELSHGWYDNGGILPPGKTIATNNTGHNEMVVPGGGMKVELALKTGAASGLEQVFISWLKEAIRGRGGKVQAVLGTGPG